jgi:two-component system, chemotaxis family, sensor kinase CheA
LNELREMGRLRVQADMAAVPPLGEMDPERCYLAWDLVLTTAAAREVIRDVFIFVEDESELRIEAVAAEPAAIDPPPVAVQRKSAVAGAAAPAATSIRVSADKLDQLVNLGAN